MNQAAYGKAARLPVQLHRVAKAPSQDRSSNPPRRDADTQWAIATSSAAFITRNTLPIDGWPIRNLRIIARLTSREVQIERMRRGLARRLESDFSSAQNLDPA